MRTTKQRLPLPAQIGLAVVGVLVLGVVVYFGLVSPRKVIRRLALPARILEGTRLLGIPAGVFVVQGLELLIMSPEFQRR